MISLDIGAEYDTEFKFSLEDYVQKSLQKSKILTSSKNWTIIEPGV